ncbi:cysteine hydrolase family protein [Nocardioides sp. URHA0020]|uniref:cysteine hydrolase family protein n=1 Tax=Nocardioides sp. URHA0020 TaxID=1380392 RepID=UPI0012DBFB2D|nr:isochorismatase family cysteine hydrolase [Nocardioides sp. URHA0020]
MNERHRPWQGVVMVDMQVDFFNDAELERCREDLVTTCNRLVDAALQRGLPVIEIRTVHRRDGSTWALNMVDDGAGMTIEGTAGAAPVDGLHHAGCTGDVALVTKTRDSAFHGTDLSDLLAAHGVESFLLCGVSTESCIAATATDAYARDLSVAVVLDATASVRWDLHDHTLAGLRAQYRQPSLSADEAIVALADAPPGSAVGADRSSTAARWGGDPGAGPT